MFDFSLLLVVVLALPVVAAVVVALLGFLEPERRGPAARWVSLGATILSLVLSAVLAAHFAGLDRSGMGDASGFRPELVRVYPLVELPFAVPPGTPAPAIQFYIGLDGLNVWLVVLTSILMVSSVLGSWTSIKERTTEFYAWLLALQAGLFGVFLSFDIVLFYVFFELTLVPLFFLIGIWGGPQRQYAARKFFVFTLTGSLITLLGVFGIVLTLAQFSPSPKVGARPLTFAIPELVAGVKDLNHVLPAEVEKTRAAAVKTKADRLSSEEMTKDAEDKQAKAEAKLSFWRSVQVFVFLAMMAGFAIKVPLVPVHTWLPLAHVEAPTAGSVLLAGVLLKIGTYGFLRLCVPLAPYASLNYGAPLIGWLAVVGILYGALCAYAQDDIKKLVAYSSVSHLGYCMLGMFALNETGLTGSLLQMVNHGLSTGGLFLLVGMLYERYHTRKMADYGGMGSKLKLLAVLMVFMGMSSVALPGLNGFWGEFAVLSGMYNFGGAQVSGRLLVYLAIGGVVLGALYTLTMLRRVFFGEVREPHHEGPGPVPDLNPRELAALAPIVICCLAIGVYPNAFTVPVAPDLQFVARIVAEERRQEQPGAGTAYADDGPRVAEADEK
jgi:NADH-quinone oxidoreductase subunit M